jgi:hypothetical protein
MSVATETMYLTLDYDDLLGMCACDLWSSAWHQLFGVERVPITPETVALLLDENFPLDWFMGEANYHTTVEADRAAGRAIALALCDDLRAAVDEHISEAAARRVDDARAEVAALDPSDHWNWWSKVAVDATCAEAGNHIAKEWLLFAPLSAATRASDLCGVVSLATDVIQFSTGLIGKAAVALPRTCADIAQFGVDNLDAIRERISDLIGDDDDDDDDYYNEDVSEPDDEDTEEEIEEGDDGYGADLDEPAAQA